MANCQRKIIINATKELSILINIKPLRLIRHMLVIIIRALKYFATNIHQHTIQKCPHPSPEERSEIQGSNQPEIKQIYLKISTLLGTKSSKYLNSVRARDFMFLLQSHRV